MRRIANNVFIILAMSLAPAPAAAICFGNDPACEIRELRSEEASREFSRDLDRIREDAEHQSERAQAPAAPPRPAPDCANRSALGAFVRGNEQGGLLGGFANMNEEAAECEQPTQATSIDRGVAIATLRQQVLAAESELISQRTYDADLPKRTCAFHEAQMKSQPKNFDLVRVLACARLSYIDPKQTVPQP